MKFASVRLVLHDFECLLAYYTKLSGIEAVRLVEEFAELRTDGAVLVISSERLIQQFNAGAAKAAANRSAIMEFQVDDVDSVCVRLSDAAVEFVMMPTIMPWGNRSMLLRDPDGNLVNVFSKPKMQGEGSVST